MRQNLTNVNNTLINVQQLTELTNLTIETGATKTDGSVNQNSSWKFFQFKPGFSKYFLISGVFDSISSSYYHITFFNYYTRTYGHVLSGVRFSNDYGTNKHVASNEFIQIPDGTLCVTICTTTENINDIKVMYNDHYLNEVNKSEMGQYITNDSFYDKGWTNAVDMDPGVYLVNITTIADFGFPSDLGRSFDCVVTNKRPDLSSFAYKTIVAFSNIGTAYFCMCNSTSSPSNPPTWYNLVTPTPAAVTGGIHQFRTALDTTKLLLLGDSITQGAGASGLSGTEHFVTSFRDTIIYTEGNSWALKLQSYLSEQYPNITVVNHGQGGLDLTNLARYISEYVPEDTTDCILGLGLNDEGKTSFDSDVATIVNYLLERNIRVYAWTTWLGTHPNRQNINTAGRVQAALVHAYNSMGVTPLPVYSIAKDYCDEHNLAYMDVMEYQSGDEIVHPNDLGHDILYKIIRRGFGF